MIDAHPPLYLYSTVILSETKANQQPACSLKAPDSVCFMRQLYD